MTVYPGAAWNSGGHASCLKARDKYLIWALVNLSGSGLL